MHIEENKDLAPFTTFAIGGPARWFAEARSDADVEEAAGWASEKGVPLFVLGGGSNLLVADKGFDGLVLRIANRGIEAGESAAGRSERIFVAAAGEDWDAFVQRSVDEDCAGLECLAGVPGTVGGTPVQNVGAYGQEVATTIRKVRALDLHERRFVDLDNSGCAFGYRRSRFNTTDRGRFIVTSVEYVLRQDGAPSLRYTDLQRAFPSGAVPKLCDVAETVREIRRAKSMLIDASDPDSRSAGSFFKNPIVGDERVAQVRQSANAEPPCYPAGADHPGSVKVSAAWLIERAGFSKGYTLGRAAISSKHTLALVNRGGASAAEIVALADQIRGAVSKCFSIQLEMEPVMLGF